jgi:hypothetical protein
MSPRLSPSPLPLLHEERERGGERSSGDPAPASVNDTESTNQHTPLPQRGSGVGGEGGPRCGSGVGGEGGPQRGSGARGEGGPQRGSGAGGSAIRSAARMCDGWRNRALAPQRSGCSDSVRSQ